MDSFERLSLDPKIKEALDSLGFTTPTEIQSKAIPYLLENLNTDLHAQAQTGTGKTLAFGIPLLSRIDPNIKSVQGLVVAPTRELVLQIYESLKDVARHTKIRIEPIYGGMSIDRQIMNIKRGAQIIIGTPGRLNDHLRRKTVLLADLKVFILDEADIMLDMGFKEEIDSILNQAPAGREIWLFSATVGPGIKQLVKSHMKDVVTIKAEKKGLVTSQVKQYYCIVPERKKISAAARFIEANPDFYGIIFCQTKLKTMEVMEQLISKGFKANCLHGDMQQNLRNQVIRGFKNRDFSILIATDVAARGIDVSGLTHVINFSIPQEFESYVHRIGRTGRAGKEGVAILLVNPGEVHRIKKLEKATQITLQEIPIPQIETIINAKMGAVSDFIEQAKKPSLTSKSVHHALNELLASFTPQEIKDALIAGLEDKFFKDLQDENLTSIPSDTSDIIPHEICIELGTDSGLSEKTVRDHLYPTCKIIPQEVQKVRVLNNKTFVSIPQNRLEECMQALRQNPLSKKAHKIYLVQDIRKERRPSREKNRRRPFGGKKRRW